MDGAKRHKKMFCRLCLIPTNDYQPLEGVLHKMLEAILLNTCLRATENPIICNICVQKIQKAFVFKSTCVNTEVTLTHYSSSQEISKLDLKMVYWIEKDGLDRVELNFEESFKICRICLEVIENNDYVSLLNTVKVNKLEDMFRIYIPELTLTLTEDPLICENCMENFRNFSAFISTSLDTESKIKNYCEGINSDDEQQVDLMKIFAPPKKEDKNAVVVGDKKASNIMKLFSEDLLWDLYGDSDTEIDDHLNAVEENERKIMKMIIEEDVDLFYRDRPDFDLHDDDDDTSEGESSHENTFFSFENPSTNCWDLPNKFEDSLVYEKLDQTLDVESPQPSSPEETPLSPEPNFKKCYDCKIGESEKNGKCYSCDEDDMKMTSDSDESKKESWKKASVCKYSSSLSTSSPVKPMSTIKKTKKDGRKCRKVYGVEYKDMWCTQCRWKKACTRFVNRSVTRR